MGRRKKTAAKPAAPAAPPAPVSGSPATKPRGRGRPRKNPLPEPPKEEEPSQSSLSTPDELSQDAPSVVSSEQALPSDDSSAPTADLPASNSKKFGKFRILHSSSPSSSSGEQPSEWASKSEPGLAAVACEEVVIESAMEVEIAPDCEPEEQIVTMEESMEVHETVVIEQEVVAEEVVEQDLPEEPVEPSIAVEVPAVEQEELKEEVLEEKEEEKEKEDESKKEIEPQFEKLSIKSENHSESNTKTKDRETPTERPEKEKKSPSKSQLLESPQSNRRRSSRIKVIQDTIVKTKAERREQQKEQQAREKERSPELNQNDDSTSDSFPPPQAPPPSCVKPVKVKSRWRRSSELEMNSSGYSPSPGVSPAASPTPSPVPHAAPKVYQPLPADEERLRNFKKLEKNIYLTQRDTNKETKRMLCDCEPVDDDERGCGEDCLNRMLMIECGPRCALGEKCSNKRFQRMEYSPIEVFRTEKKGFGLRALAFIKGGAFLSEYVGEVLDPYEFQRRAEDYANDKNRHYYFMALKSDAIIDATVKGNNSRFINHSCDPNAETQKWTVNGELRIGFFSIKDVCAGEEVTFDYQLQRYGKEAQKCFCEASNCRGWIGGDPDKEDKEETTYRKGKAPEKKDKKSKPKPRFSIVQELLEDQDLENEVHKLCQTGLKNKHHTLNFSRLMVRVEKQEKRKRLLELLSHADAPCRRLFLDYHGLRLVWSWMVDPNNILRLEIMTAMENLPISNKTVLQDAKIYGVIEKWEVESRAPPPKPEEEKTEPAIEDEKAVIEQVVKEEPVEKTVAKPEDVEMEDVEAKELEVKSVEMEIKTAESETKEIEAETKKDSETVKIELETKQVEEGTAEPSVEAPGEKPVVIENIECPEGPATKEAVEEKKEEAPKPPAIDLERLAAENKIAKKLLELWSCLPEVFKIPKKERKEQIKEHEREAERSYQTYLETRGYRAEYSENEKTRQDRYRGAAVPYSSIPSSYKRGRDIRDDTRKPIRPPERYEDRVLARMDKFQRRQLFAQRVEQEERAKREQMWLEKQERERMQQLSLLQEQQQPPPHILMDANGVPCFFDPDTNSWHAYQGPPAASDPHAEQQPQFDASAWQHVFQIPIPPLPPKWRAAYDAEGFPFYYHVKKRVPQWVPPSLVPTPGSLSSSDQSSSSTETDSVEESEEEVESGSSDEDQSQEESVVKKTSVGDDSDEDEEGKEETADGEPCVPGEENLDGKSKDEEEEADDEEENMEVVQPKKENRRREGLVKELIIISPRREEDIPTISSKMRYRKAKEQVRKEKEAALRKQHQLKAKEKSRDKMLRTIKIKTPPGVAVSGLVDAEAEKKIKEDFLAKMASTVVSTLNPHHKPECQQGRITSSEDFKHLARKLTNFVMLKELKHCRKVSDLTCNESVRHKAREYIKKYMAKFGELYIRDSEREHKSERHSGSGETLEKQEDHEMEQATEEEQGNL